MATKSLNLAWVLAMNATNVDCRTAQIARGFVTLPKWFDQACHLDPRGRASGSTIRDTLGLKPILIRPRTAIHPWFSRTCGADRWPLSGGGSLAARQSRPRDRSIDKPLDGSSVSNHRWPHDFKMIGYARFVSRDVRKQPVQTRSVRTTIFSSACSQYHCTLRGRSGRHHYYPHNQEQL